MDVTSSGAHRGGALGLKPSKIYIIIINIIKNDWFLFVYKGK